MLGLELNHVSKSGPWIEIEPRIVIKNNQKKVSRDDSYRKECREITWNSKILKNKS